MNLSRQELWSGLPFPHQGALPDSGTEPISLVSPALQADSSLLHHLGSPGTTLWLFSRVRLCNPTDCSLPGVPVLHYVTEFAMYHVDERFKHGLLNQLTLYSTQ